MLKLNLGKLCVNHLIEDKSEPPKMKEKNLF